MKKLLIFSFTLVLLLSCKKTKEESAIVLSSNVDINLVDAAGNDLLDPNIPNTYNNNRISISYVTNGNPIVYHDNSDYPNGYFIFKENMDSLYTIRVFLNFDKNEKYPTTLIHWKNNETDTIRTKFKYINKNIILDSLWYNGVLKWDFNMNKRSLIEIVK